MTKFQLGLLIGFFLGALAIFVTLGIIQLYLSEEHERRRQVMNRTSLGAAADTQSSSFYAPVAQSFRNSEPQPARQPMSPEEPESIVVLFVLIE